VGQGADKGDKGVYKAITGAKKYFIANLFLIPTDDDPEGNDDYEKQMKNLQTNKPVTTKVETPAASKTPVVKGEISAPASTAQNTTIVKASVEKETAPAVPAALTEPKRIPSFNRKLVNKVEQTAPTQAPTKTTRGGW